MQREGTLPGSRLVAAIPLTVLCAVWAWWATKEGAYFGSVLYPGLVVLCAGLVLVASRTAWPERLRLPTPAKLALAGLLGLAAWSALSALWSPSPDIAVADAQRVFGYALAFGLGVWLTTVLRPRLHVAMAPLAFAGLFAGAVAVVGMLTGDELARYADAGTLDYPLGYRNANAAFFLIALWPAVGLAATRELDWRLRAIALGAATLCVELALLSQSRGSMIALPIALAVFLVVSRDRARDVAWLALAVLPALVVIPAVSDLYQTRAIESYEGLAELRNAGRAALGGALIAIAIGAFAASLGRRYPASPGLLARANRTVAIGAVAIMLAGLAGFAIATGDPLEWVGERVDEFQSEGTPHATDVGSRYSLGAGSERHDLWRVALEDAGDDPLLGLGAGGFQYSYLLDRNQEGLESVRDAHSVEFEVLSELGIPGLGLFVLAVGAAAAGAWRTRRLGPGAAALSTCALTAGAYWLGHASLDWFWTYPAVTAPVFALLGSACVSSGAVAEGTQPSAWRRAATLGALALALSVVSPYLSERYVAAAYDGFRADPAQAQSYLDRARDLNPLSIEPLLAEGGIAQERGEREQAIAAFEEAVDERPEEWASHYFLAALHRDTDPARARAELGLALELNPRSRQLEDLRERLDAR